MVGPGSRRDLATAPLLSASTAVSVSVFQPLLFSTSPVLMSSLSSALTGVAIPLRADHLLSLHPFVPRALNHANEETSVGASRVQWAAAARNIRGSPGCSRLHNFHSSLCRNHSSTSSPTRLACFLSVCGAMRSCKHEIRPCSFRALD